MAVETVVLCPGVKQQVRTPRAQLAFAALKQELIIEAPHDAGYAAVIEPGNRGKILLDPPACRIQQERSRHASAPGRKRRRRPATGAQLIGTPLDPQVKILGADVRIARQVDPAQPRAVGGLRARARHERHDQDRDDAGRKRMAELACVHDAIAVPRVPAGIIAPPGSREPRPRGPVATGKWLTASVTDDIPAVIAAGLAEAQRRDPERARTWIALAGTTSRSAASRPRPPAAASPC
jgi:hypothetical protein